MITANVVKSKPYPKQAAAEGQKPWRDAVARLDEQQQRGQTERVASRVVWLIPEQALQAVNREAQVEPARDGIDV